MDRFRILGQIGEGAHGLIFRGTGLQPERDVALKKIFISKVEEGVPRQILREIKAMQVIDSKYVMKLVDYFAHGASVVLVFDFMPSGLSEMIHDKDIMLTESHIKTYMRMLLKGVACLHRNRIMHRDLKPANLLINSDGILKIGDFGLARLKWPEEKKNKSYTHQVATRWYRAPELLYGARKYSEAVDLWATGCILAEMYNKSPLFAGETDIDQLAIVVNSLGSPSEKNWAGVSKLPDFNKISFPNVRPIQWASLIPTVSNLTLDFVSSFLKYDPTSRISAEKALSHQYFYQFPLPCKESELPKPPSDHREILRKRELESRMHKQNDFYQEFNQFISLSSKDSINLSD